MFIYGPVSSRRLGFSLGIDIIPYKTCSFDCIYCQLGKTTNKTIEIKEWTKEKDILNALESRINSINQSTNQLINYITFSGSGEPTLNSKLGSLIKKVKQISPIPVAVLTNSSLFYMEKIREELMPADLVLPSFSTATPALFEKVNRPHHYITLELMIEGLHSFCNEFKGLIWLEVMLIKNTNDSPEHIRKLMSIVGTNSIRAKLDKIHLNTVVRPPAEKFALPLDDMVLQKVAREFISRSYKTEVIADFKSVSLHPSPCPLHGEDRGEPSVSPSVSLRVYELIKRRPVTPEELSDTLALPLNDVLKYITLLEQEGKIKKEMHNDTIFYK